MRICFIIILLLLFRGTGYSQLFEDSIIQMYRDGVTPRYTKLFIPILEYNSELLKNRKEILEKGKIVYQTLQENCFFPIELKDTLSSVLNAHSLRVFVHLDVDTLGKVEDVNVVCSQFPLVVNSIKEMIINHLPDLPPGIRDGNKKVRVGLFIFIRLFSEEEIKGEKQNFAEQETWRFFLYPLFKD